MHLGDSLGGIVLLLEAHEAEALGGTMGGMGAKRAGNGREENGGEHAPFSRVGGKEEEPTLRSVHSSWSLQTRDWFGSGPRLGV